MKWKATNKATPVKPKLGDKKEKLKFALFPIKIDDNWIWWEKYIGVYEYKERLSSYDEVVSQGIFTEKYRTIPCVIEVWELIERKQ